MVTFFLLVLSFAAQANLPLKSQLACKSDKDCAITSPQGCGCGGGGSQIAINTHHLKSWEKKFAGFACIALVSDDPSCKKTNAVCINKICQLK